MNDNDQQDACYTDEYKRLLSEAYPMSRRDIHAEVMSRITAEESRRRVTRRRMSLFVKLGSAAACLVLLVTLGFRVVPMMNSLSVEDTEAVTFDTSNVAEDASAAQNESAMLSAETEVATYATSGSASAEEGLLGATRGTADADKVTTDGKSEKVVAYSNDLASVEEDEIVLEEAVEEEATVEEAAEAIEPDFGTGTNGAMLVGGMMYATRESATDSSDCYGDSSGSSVDGLPEEMVYISSNCPHDSVFHVIPSSVIELAVGYIGEETVREWWNENAGTCEMNIYSFLHCMMIPQELFEEVCSSSDLDYDSALLYGDRSAAYDYYTIDGQ